MALLLQVGVLVALFIAYRFISSALQARRFRAFAKENGCAEPLDLSSAWHKSHQRLVRLLNVKKSGEDIIEDILAEDFKQASTSQRGVFDGSRFIASIEPANLQAMLATQFKDFETGHLRYQQLSPVLGRSIFTSDGAFWEHSRALFRPQFSRDNINDLDSTDKAVSALIQALGPINYSGWTNDVDMLPLCFNFTLDTATEFLFGESVNSQAVAIRAVTGQHGLSNDVKEAGMESTTDEFKENLLLIADTLLTRVRLQRLYWLGDGFKFRKALRSGAKFTEHFVQRALNATDSGKVEGKKDNLLARLATQTRDGEELRNQTLAILFAGRDTTASLLGWCFARLALHPDVFEKLRNVILHDFVPGEPISFAKLKSCRYLQFVLNETLRLHPTVPMNYRVAARDTTLPAGGGSDERSPIAIAKGEVVFYSVFLLHRRKDLWGDDALEFKPERWEKRIPAFQYLPVRILRLEACGIPETVANLSSPLQFSGGPRICIGQQFALTEASYVLVRLLQHFDRMEPVDRPEMLKLRKQLGITMAPDGVKVRLHKA